MCLKEDPTATILFVSGWIEVTLVVAAISHHTSAYIFKTVIIQ